MTQLILDVGEYAVALPESIKGGYSAFEEDLSTELLMISGRMVKEVRGTVWRVNYQYGFFPSEMKNRVISACRKGRRTPIICSFLPPEGLGGELVTSNFFVTSFQEPKFMWSTTNNEQAQPLWADFSVELREVRPHA